MAEETPVKIADQLQLALERTFLAHERTLMAWVRTAASLITFGFTLYKFFYPEATRRHIRAALAAGATREEILLVLKCSCLLAVHSCSLSAPILLEEAKAAGVKPAGRGKGEPTPACDTMREIGQWNTAWDPFFEMDPVWTDQFFATALGLYQTNVMSAKDVELLSIAFDASITHMYAPGTRRHIKGALKLGASMEEIMEVLKLCVAAGAEVCRMAVPILAEELERNQREK